MEAGRRPHAGFLLYGARKESNNHMYKGIYIAVSGAVLKLKQMDVLSQNLANANTAGYKKDTASFQDYLMQQAGDAESPDGRTMSMLAGVSTDFSNGNLIRTGNPFDVGLEGDGFIALEGGRYTRRGDLRRDKDDYLVTGGGVKVLGGGGPVQLPEGSVVIGERGDLSVDGVQVDTISIRKFARPDQLARVDGGMFVSADPGAESDASVRQGYVEASNVEVIREMVKMIETVREFEAYQKVIQTFDEAAGKVNNEIGRM